MSKIEKLMISPEKGKRLDVETAKLLENHGMENDRFANRDVRQLSLCAGEWREIILHTDGFCKRFAPNIVTRGLEYTSLCLGDRFSLGEAVIEISGIGKECHGDCPYINMAPPCLFYQNCAYAMVIHSGAVAADDEMEKLEK